MSRGNNVKCFEQSLSLFTALYKNSTLLLFIKLLFQVQLVGPVGPRLQKLLNPSIAVPKESLTESDEVHLIMEYQAGEKWGKDTATLANRFITSYDEANGKMTMMETYFKSIREYKPDLVILSGE
jgi:ADP-dependent phosphofructokinase/glucokinase